ncbi:hypothetical protein NEF87_004227 [Candidatus Lokiarchaeum ossiferum]|uniref:Flavin reductase like domain-containing protein n=1 Tax=Candidatus Lokiarchaeum ossiferum TaxID=2951803 RepID=A0ABY6HWP9_9ARCH|nr:hypothetical protein NEF87_004227 [Candidatus Lokiarchaeum sp. B-35]
MDMKNKDFFYLESKYFIAGKDMNEPQENTNTVQFEPLINYESIICVRFLDNPQKINAACIGVHFTSNNEVYIHAYSDTHTRAILQPGVTFVINFSECFYEFVIAGLKTKGIDERVDELPISAYRDDFSVPVLKSSWCAVECEVIPMPSKILSKPECRRREAPNIRAKIKSIHTFHYPHIFNNRSMNLAIEALIYATRIPLYEKYSKEYKESLTSYLTIKKKITEWRDMDRFEESFTVIDNFLIDRNVKVQELFDFSH